MKHLLIGGARSGKSRLAEDLCLQSGADKLFYLATGWAGDDEMQARIQHHKATRSDCFKVLEVPVNLTEALAGIDDSNAVILIDCLTLWLSNCLHFGNWGAQREALIHLLPTLNASVVMVTNEVGSGVVPFGQLSREFVDEAGRLHQDVAKLCDRVDLVVAGMALSLKDIRS